MSFKLDKNILAQAMSDEKRAKDIIDYLNEAVDNELDKPCNEMDAEFIDECIRIIEAIEEGDFESIAEEPSENEENISVSDKDSAKEQTNTDKPKTRTVIRFRRILAVAAVLAIAITATLQAFPAVADEIKDYFIKISQELFNFADKTEMVDENIVQLDTDPEVMPLINNIREANLDNVNLYAVYKDGSRKQITLSDPACVVGKPTLTRDDEGEKYVSIIISYNNESIELKFYFNNNGKEDSKNETR